MLYNKLVRDKVPDIINSRGEKSLTRVASRAEFWRKLLAKLEEEVAEFRKTPTIEEMADIREVLCAICAYRGFRTRRVLEAQVEKRRTHGAFKKRLILVES